MVFWLIIFNKLVVLHTIMINKHSMNTSPVDAYISTHSPSFLSMALKPLLTIYRSRSVSVPGVLIFMTDDESMTPLIGYYFVFGHFCTWVGPWPWVYYCVLPAFPCAVPAAGTQSVLDRSQKKNRNRARRPRFDWMLWLSVVRKAVWNSRTRVQAVGRRIRS